MKTTLRTDLTVADICNGFVYNQLEGKGLFGLGGKLTIQPEYQRNFMYADKDGSKEQAVIDWVSTVFADVLPEMKGLEWGRLYEEYHGQSYDPKKLSDAVKKLAADPQVTSRKRIFEYLLGGSVAKKLLAVRVFDDKIKQVAFAKQSQAAKGKSNCPLCAIGDNANTSRIYQFEEMDADHVAAWSKGGDSSAKNCEMLCKTHNQSKGNR